MRKGFTLIEVMVAVMIISVVILALLNLKINNSHIFAILDKKIETNQYITLLISNENFGFKKKSINLYDLVDNFDIESDLRRELKNQKVDINYKELQRFDLGDETNESEGADMNLVLELGESSMRLNDYSASLYRLKLD